MMNGASKVVSRVPLIILAHTRISESSPSVTSYKLFVQPMVNTVRNFCFGFIYINIYHTLSRLYYITQIQALIERILGIIWHIIGNHMVM